MADTRTVDAPARHGWGVFYGWRIVAALAITQTIGYGTLFYSFGVILTPMRDDLSLSPTMATGAMTFGLLICAVASVPVGRLLDRHGGRLLMTTGSIAATVLLVAYSQVQSATQLYLVFAGIGLVSAMVLYETAFAVVVTWFHRRRATALLAITVVAGFASTIFMPLTGWLTEAYGWRHAILTLAVIHAMIAIPLHFVIRRPAELGLYPDGDPAPAPAASEGALTDRTTILRTAFRDPFYWTLGVALVAHAVTGSVMSIHLVAYLVELGHPTAFAAAITGLLGVLSVTGRLVTTAAQRRFSLTAIAALIFAIQALAAFALPLAGRSDLGAVLCVLGIGLGFGVVSIIKPALLAAQYGTTAFGTLSGTMAMPMTIAKAVGPFAAAGLLAAAGSYDWVITVIGAILLASAAAMYIAGRYHSPSPEDSRRTG